jgi:hypothetical protein
MGLLFELIFLFSPDEANSSSGAVSEAAPPGLSAIGLGVQAQPNL